MDTGPNVSKVDCGCEGVQAANNVASMPTRIRSRSALDGRLPLGILLFTIPGTYIDTELSIMIARNRPARYAREYKYRLLAPWMPGERVSRHAR